MKRTAKSIQADIAKGAFRPHTALSTMALAYYQQDSTTLAKNMFPVCGKNGNDGRSCLFCSKWHFRNARAGERKKPAGLHSHRGSGRDDVYAGGRRDNTANGGSKGS